MKNYEATEIAYKNGYEKGYADGVKVASSSKQLASKWIPVTERLPEKVGKYLAVTKSCFKKGETYIQLLWYGAKSGFHYSDPDFGCMKMNKWVTHWMPLPQPPEGE